MRKTRFGAALSLALVAAWLFCATGSLAQSAVTVKLQDPRSKPAAQIIADPAEFAWELFIALDWPELPGYRGIPDPNGHFGQSSATVWESYKNVSEIYLAHGERPSGWETDTELPMAGTHRAHPTKTQLAAIGPVDSNWVHFLAEPVMIDGQQVCDSESNVLRYDVRGNRSYFDYVVNNPAGYPLFNMQGQAAALADSGFTFNFPSDTVEVKASWRILSPTQDPSHYWTAVGVYVDKYSKLHTVRIGLTGLHIISKALPNWVWITFEQVENPTKTFTYLLGEKGAAVGANPNYNSALTPYNQLWQSAMAGTKWQYYALMNTQTQYVNSAQQPTLLSNTQMETYFQPSSSCISCHNLASIGPKQNPRLHLFYPLNPYVGNIDFQAVVNQQYPTETFKPMDFVWSLRNAQYRKVLPPSAKSSPTAGKAGISAAKPVASAAKSN